jgi:hypothetical protein
VGRDVNSSASGIAPHASRKQTMDVEHINAIGNSLADLTVRTVGLRGYL